MAVPMSSSTLKASGAASFLDKTPFMTSYAWEEDAKIQDCLFVLFKIFNIKIFNIKIFNFKIFNIKIFNSRFSISYEVGVRLEEDSMNAIKIQDSRFKIQGMRLEEDSMNATVLE